MLKAMRKIAEDEDLPFAFDFMQMAFTTFSLPEEEDEKTNASVSKVFDPQAQLKKDPLGKFLKYQDELLKHEYVPVSYTHLDVYKRQVVTFSVLIFSCIHNGKTEISINYVKKNGWYPE